MVHTPISKLIFDFNLVMYDLAMSRLYGFSRWQEEQKKIVRRAGKVVHSRLSGGPAKGHETVGAQRRNNTTVTDQK